MKADINTHYSLSIDLPSGEYPLVEYGRHFNVQGKIRHDLPLKDDFIIYVSLYDEKGKLLRHVSSNRKNDHNVLLYHPDLITYKEELDPGRKGILSFGFPELIVKDLNDPEASFQDATIKCFYNDDLYKAVIITASDAKHGLIFDDGVNFLDENKKPYEILKQGEYTIRVELKDNEDNILACTDKKIKIGKRTDQCIVRFNPIEHKKRMIAWCKENNFAIINDLLPGYLDSYLGTWYYHMGLLTMYRTSDIALYSYARIHMFDYLIDPTSTSYETELCFLQSQGVIRDHKRFNVYHYDIGEATIFDKQAKIIKFEDNEYLYIYRIDIINDKAKENFYKLGNEAVERSITSLDDIKIEAGSLIAICGVVKPWQLDKNDLALRKNNTYEVFNDVSTIHYEINDGKNIIKDDRKLLMERYTDHSIGTSVYEFYNIFQLKQEYKGRKLSFKITAADKKAVNPEASLTLEIAVI